MGTGSHDMKNYLYSVFRLNSIYGVNRVRVSDLCNI